MTAITADDISLTQTCGACPEQYDAYDPAGKQVGYLRLRHGWFTVDMPDAGGQEVYSAQPDGDGVFDPDERDGYLRTAREKIAEHLNAVAGSPGDGAPQVTVSARWLLDHGLWTQACDLTGMNSWAINEGQMDPSERVTLTLEQARELGMLR